MPLSELRIRLSRSLLTVPVAVVVIIFVLGMFKVSGSSVALLSETDPSAQSAFQPRPSRSDEYAGRTPLVIRQEVNGFPRSTQLGMGTHDTGVLSDLPVKTTSAVIKPHSWAYFVFDVERAFAIEWWIVMFGPLLGVYAVLAVLTRSPVIAGLSGLLVTASPAAGWWAIPAMGLPILYGGLVAACLIAAIRAVGRRRYALAAGAGYFSAAFVAMLYLPWLIPLTLIFGATVLVQLPGRVSGWRQFGLFVLAAGGTFIVLMAIYFQQHHEAIRAITNSVYPGDRVFKSAETEVRRLFSAPFDVFATAPASADISGTNQSEAASGLMLWFPIAVVGGAFTGLRSRSPSQRALAAVMWVSLLLAAWSLLPVPQRVGALFGLTSVQASRLALPLTVAGALAAGLYVHRVREGGLTPSRERIAIAAVSFAFVTGWAGAQVVIQQVGPDRSEIVALLLLGTAVIAAILAGKRWLGLGGACALLLFGSVRINPIQVGLDPILANPLAAQINAVRAGDESAVWVTLTPERLPQSILNSTGAPTVSGISWYADEDFWRRVDPTDAQRFTWDRLAYIIFQADEEFDELQLELRAEDLIALRSRTCDGVLQQLDVTYAIADQDIVSPCLELISPPITLGERWIYRVLSQVEESP